MELKFEEMNMMIKEKQKNPVKEDRNRCKNAEQVCMNEWKDHVTEQRRLKEKREEFQIKKCISII